MSSKPLAVPYRAGKRAEKGGSLRRQRDVRLLDKLAAFADRMAGSQGADELQLSFAAWLAQLTSGQLMSIRRAWPRLPAVRQKQLHRAICEVVDLDGPARNLLRGIREDEEAWSDSLPEPPNSGKTAAEWNAILRKQGFSDDLAREWANRLSPSDRDDDARELANGLPPEKIDAFVTQLRRRRKWSAVLEAMLHPEQLARVRAREDRLRIALPDVVRHADKIAGSLSSLLVNPPAATSLLAGAMFAFRDSVLQVILAGQPDAPTVGERNSTMRIVVPRPGEEAFWAWQFFADLASDVIDGAQAGMQIDPGQVATLARGIGDIARAAEAVAGELERERGRPQKVALDAAAKLRAMGLSWPQIATVLERRGFLLDPHTPENIRKSLAARFRRAAALRPRRSSG